MRLSTCNAIGCSSRIVPQRTFCDKHWTLVELDTRKVLERTFKPGRLLQSQVFRLTLERAQQEVLFHQTNGHAMPRPQSFDFDDQGKVL